MPRRIPHQQPDPSVTTPLDDFALLARLKEVLLECKARFTKESPSYRADPANISRLNQWVTALLNRLERMEEQYEAIVERAARQRGADPPGHGEQASGARPPPS